MYIIVKGNTSAYYIRSLQFKVTNNEAKYEAMLVGLAITRALGANELNMKANSQVMVSQIMGEYLAKGEKFKDTCSRYTKGETISATSKSATFFVKTIGSLIN